MIKELLEVIPAELAVGLIVIFLINARIKDFFKFHCNQNDLDPIVEQLQISLESLESRTAEAHEAVREKFLKTDKAITDLTIKGM